MAISLSSMKGLEVFTDNGKRVGTAHDFIIDLETGKVVKILLAPMGKFSGEELREFLATKSINYGRVKNITDAIIIGGK